MISSMKRFVTKPVVHILERRKINFIVAAAVFAIFLAVAMGAGASDTAFWVLVGLAVILPLILLFAGILFRQHKRMRNLHAELNRLRGDMDAATRQVLAEALVRVHRVDDGVVEVRKETGRAMTLASNTQKETHKQDIYRKQLAEAQKALERNIKNVSHLQELYKRQLADIQKSLEQNVKARLSNVEKVQKTDHQEVKKLVESHDDLYKKIQEISNQLMTNLSALRQEQARLYQEIEDMRIASENNAKQFERGIQRLHVSVAAVEKVASRKIDLERKKSNELIKNIMDSISAHDKSITEGQEAIARLQQQLEDVSKSASGDREKLSKKLEQIQRKQRQHIREIEKTLRSEMSAVGEDAQKNLKKISNSLKSLQKESRNKIDAIEQKLSGINELKSQIKKYKEKHLKSLQEDHDRKIKDIEKRLSAINELRSLFQEYQENTDEQLSRKLEEFLSPIHEQTGLQESELERVKQALEATEAELARLKEEQEKQLRTYVREAAQLDDVGQRLAKVENLDPDRINKEIGEISKEFQTITKRLEHFSENSQFYQGHNRKLSGQVLGQLGAWARRLGLNENEKSIAYMADHIVELERRLAGRLAASIEDMMLRLLVVLAIEREERHVLEIGALFGISGAAIYNICQEKGLKLRLTMIDPFSGYYGKEVDILTGLPVTKEQLERNFQTAGVQKKDYRIIQAKSQHKRAITAASKSRYDALIIDGDHSYDIVKNDLENYGKMVEKGGYIIFDDYGNESWPDVKRYVDEEVLEKRSDLELVGTEFTTIVFRRV